MNGFGVFLALCVLLYCCISWVVPRLLAWLCKRRLGVEVRVGRIAVPYLRLRDVSLACSGFSVHIDEIGVRSSFFSSDVAKLLAVVARDVRINNDVSGQQPGGGSAGGEPDLRGARVPPLLLSLAQFMALRVQRITAMVLHAQQPEWLVHAAAAELHVDASVVQSARALLVSASLAGASAKLLRHAPPPPTGRSQAYATPQPAQAGACTGSSGMSAEACLGEVTLAAALEATVAARGPLSVERLCVAVENTKAVVHDGFYAFLRAQRRPRRSPRHHSPASNLSDPEEMLLRLEPVIPKNVQLRIVETSISGLRAGRPECQASLQRLQLSAQRGVPPAAGDGSTMSSPRLPAPLTLAAAAQVEAARIHCGRDPLLRLDKLTVNAKLEEGLLNLFVVLSSLGAVYDHAQVHAWVAEHLSASGPVVPHTTTASGPDTSDSEGDDARDPWLKEAPGWLGRLVGPLQVRGCAEVSAVSLLLRLPPEPDAPSPTMPHALALSCARAKMAVEQPKGQMPGRWAAELLVEVLACTLGEAAEAAAANAAGGSMEAEAGLQRRFHTWGAPLFLGTLLAKLKPEDSPAPSAAGGTAKDNGATTGAARRRPRLSAMLDALRFEMSPALALCVLRAIGCWEEYRLLRQPPSGSRGTRLARTRRRAHAPTAVHELSLWASLRDAHATVSLASVNAFFLASAASAGSLGSSAGKEPAPLVCVALRVDTASAERCGGRVSIATDGVKLLSPGATAGGGGGGGGGAFACLRAEEAGGAVAFVRRARFTARARKDVQLQLLDDVELQWSAALHLKLLALWREAGALKAALPLLKQGQPPAATPTARPPDPAELMRVSVHAQGRLVASACAGPRRPAAVLSATELEVAWGGVGSEWVCCAPSLALAVDGAPLFRATGAQLRRVKDSAEVRAERRAAEGLKLAWNPRCWSLSFASFAAVFPYEHRFADAFHDELLSVVRWLRQTHRAARPGTSTPNADAPLPPDLIIKIGEFLFEMSDDPFEVRLRDNLELLIDEHEESLKRQKMLDAKVAELCKQHLLLPAGKVEELYAALSKKNAQIYVQRSQQMSKAAPARTRLFAWLMSDVEILALADPSLHGPRNAKAAMCEIDPDSPWPEEGLEFSTLWCRAMSISCREWSFQLRDFPQPLLDIRTLRLWGRLVGAEQEASPRAKRTVSLQLGEPWGDATVERSLTALKFYHDFNCDVEHYSYAFGPCWEPVIAQCNLSFEKIVPPSRDPSPPLPFWDKMRLLFHGRLTMCVRTLTVLLHASLDPYNTTEEMELTWSDVAMDWTNGKVVFKGELNVYVRTASKYDDCRLLHLPNLRLTLKLQWVCLGDPCDHHAVVPCAPDKLPEYSSNQEHDSFRAFRSQNLNMSVALETRPPPAGSPNPADCPVVLLYGSTLRWFENLKLILSGVTRPTRRGAVFHNVRPRRPQLSRHYRRLHLLLGLHRFHVYYWMSFAMQRGCELLGGRLSCSSEHTLTLVPVDDGLTHRARADWAIAYMNCELTDAEMWLKSALRGEGPGASQDAAAGIRPPVEKCYCLSVAKVSYGREAALPLAAAAEGPRGDTPTHRLVVYDLKGAWTKSNRDVAFALFDAFVKTKQLKKNLSTEALKGFRAEGGGAGGAATPPKGSRGRGRPPSAPAAPAATDDATPLTPAGAAAVEGAGAAAAAAGAQATPSPMSKLQSGVAASMLQRLIAEADNKAVVFSDEPSSMAGACTEPLLRGRASCREDDALHKNWLIALVNSQVLLKGCETRGYVILSAAKAEILQREHRPVWRDRTPVSKTTWVGSLECMQYYATVSAGESDSLDENIMWLSVEHIQERGAADASGDIQELPDVPHLVGSGSSVGGVVSQTVGAAAAGAAGDPPPPLQLQRIVSRCRCEFFYAAYGDASSVAPAAAAALPPPPPPQPDGAEGSALGGPWEPAVDAFTLMHHDLDVCTNSLQYAMILDIVNNLLLHVEPRRKEAAERLQRMRFQLQLSSIDDQRRPIQQLQNQVRSMVSKLRRLERESYLLERAAAEVEDGEVPEAYQQEMEEMDRQVNECKEALNTQSEELDMMISCYKETQLSANQRLATMRGDKPVTTVRANEIVFKHAQWRLTEADGQLGIADLVLSNFLYTKNSKSDDSGEHLLELGYVRMTNLLPNQAYTEVLCPTEIQSNMPVDRKRAVRVFCREKAPVGGISIKEHFEINVVPLTIGLTKKFFNTMLKFCFPERDPDTIDGDGTEDLETEGKSKKGKGKKSKEASFYVPIDQKDDVEKMKERAEKNKLFIYIKIPEVPVKVSYKGNKDKNLEDIRDFSLVIPTLEYHNVTWTWLDLLLAMKNDSRRVILSQAIKQKLQIKMPKASSDEGASPQEEDKARMLFGSRLMPGDGRSIKKGVFKLSK